MNKCKIVMLSPHHADRDYRVRRSIEVIAELFVDVDIYWDQSYEGHQYVDAQYGAQVRELYRENRDHEFIRLILGQGVLHQDIVDSIQSTNLVYVHASGIEGLLYCRAVKKINPSCWVVFDYHDSLTYELFYQLKKLGLSCAFKLSWSVYRYYLKGLMKSVDALVGISNTQLNDFQKLLGRKIVTASVPNFRKFSPCFESERKVDENDELALVWLGSVMQGRDLSLLTEWISQLSVSPHLHIFGNIINQSVVGQLESLLGNKVSFYGEFKDEGDIYPKLPSRVIGVFLGWDDPQDTNINSHASPNKYFTYINMELPVIINSSLSELAADVHTHKAGISISSVSEFDGALQEISGKYQEYSVGSRKLKQYYSGIDPKRSISEFLQKNIQQVGCE